VYIPSIVDVDGNTLTLTHQLRTYSHKRTQVVIQTVNVFLLSRSFHLRCSSWKLHTLSAWIYLYSSCCHHWTHSQEQWFLPVWLFYLLYWISYFPVS